MVKLEWRKIKVHDENTNYSVLSFGHIKNDITNKILSPFVDKDGYLRATIAVSPRITYKTMVQRFVAKAFIPNPDNKPIVNHKDGKKQNNYYGNLEWATHSENIKHAFDNGLKFAITGECNTLAVYKETQIKEACKYMKYGIPNKLISQRLGIDRQYLTDIRFGRRWHHIWKQYMIEPQLRPCEVFKNYVIFSYDCGKDPIDILAECWGESSNELMFTINNIISQYVKTSETILTDKTQVGEYALTH